MIQGVQLREIDEIFKHSFIRERRDDTTTIKTFSEGQNCEPVNPRILEPFHVSCMGKKGFTLIEIIVVIVIAGILLPVIVVPFVSAVKGSGKPEKATTAMYLAHQKMEELMKFDYSRAELNTIALTLPGPAPISGYQWQYAILYVPSSDLKAAGSANPPDTGYKRILVRVTDPEGDTYHVYSVVTHFPDWR